MSSIREELKAWATSILIAADAHQSELAGTSAFSSVLVADETEIQQHVRSHKDDNAIFVTVCNTYASSPQLAVEFACRRGHEWRYPFKLLKEISSRYASIREIPWNVSETIAKLTEVILQGIRAVAAEISDAIESVGPEGGVWKVTILGTQWKVPGKWDRRGEVARLFSENSDDTRDQLGNISERVESAFVASQAAFEALIELEELVKKWSSWNIYLNVRMAMVKMALTFFDERSRLAQLMRTETADCFLDGVVEVALSTIDCSEGGKRRLPVEALNLLAIMLECADDLDEDAHTRRAELMLKKIRRRLRNATSCPGRALFEKVEFAVKESDVDAIGPLLVICSYACQDHSVHNRFSRLQLQRLIPGCDDRSDNELEKLFAHKNLEYIKCENQNCGKLLKRSPRCTKCLHAFYCGRECQVQDFPAHKLECSPLKKCLLCQQR